MNEFSTVEWLAKAVGQATRTAKFCVVGRLPDINPGLEVEGLGSVRFPLKPAIRTKLIDQCDVAPFGKGTRTLVDRNVRNTFELDAQKFHLSGAWNAAVAQAAKNVAEELGLPPDQLEPRLYKLLVYERGGFFLPHRDSEKHDRMVASMIVVLPNRFEGGDLIVRHGPVEKRLTYKELTDDDGLCYAAFYADCEHEVKRVTSGVRVCLAYNLVLQQPRGRASAVARSAAPIEALAESIESWVAKQPAKPLVFTLEHHYTQRGLALELLKGADRQLADLVVPAAEKADCLVHLTQVERHTQQYAGDDEEFERNYSRRRATTWNEDDLGETYEDDLSGSDWTNLQGEKQPWGPIAFDLSGIVSSTPINAWKPTTEEFEGYTGNAGNTLDRWYHRSAIVVWRSEHHFDVVASSGIAKSIPLFCSMVAKLDKAPKKNWLDARNDCLRFAFAIMDRWPKRRLGRSGVLGDEKSPDDGFLESLLALGDRDAIAMLLSVAAERDESARLSSFVVAACRKFGWSEFADELKQLISARPAEKSREEISLRDVEWLAAFCCDKAADPDKSALASELCTMAVERFRKPVPEQGTYYSGHRHDATSSLERSLPLLVKALAASGCDADLARAIRFVLESPDAFSIDKCQAPALKSLISWSKKRFSTVHPQLASWLSAVREWLERATASKPTPPSNWARPASVPCTCEFCAQLKTFLTDPAKETTRIRAAEGNRHHLIECITRRQCDVTHVLERKGSPYSLVLTKTSASFERILKEYEKNGQLLRSLPTASDAPKKG